jgi:hypothetical protein
MVARIKVEKKQTNFTIVPNEILQSKDLSLQAKGLIAQCLSFPDNWNYSINGLVAVVKEGKTAVMNTIKELERHGYVKRNRIHDENGKFAGIEYVITDYPNLDKPHTENLNMVKTQVNQPYAGKPNMVKPNTDKPISENQPQNNTIYKKENNINNNIVLDINIINDYIDKNNLKFVNAREFYNYYSQRGWKTNADEPITNWQALLVNWNNRNKIRIEEERERQRKINERHSYAVDSHNVPQSVPLEVPEFSPEQANSFLSRLASNGKQSNIIQSLIQSVVQGKEIK